MKYLILQLTLLMMISCTKTNLVSVTHKIQYWSDTVPEANSAWECPGDNTWFADTVLYYNDTPAKVVFGRPVIVTVIAKKDSFDRKYFEYLN